MCVQQPMGGHLARGYGKAGGDEGINTLATIIPSVEILGPIT
jgi:hypothetical protein